MALNSTSEVVDRVDGANWRPREEGTLCFVIQDGQILLIEKKRGLGAGKVNGPGGRLEKGETAEQAAIRETQEEVGITPTGVQWAGELRFQFFPQAHSPSPRPTPAFSQSTKSVRPGLQNRACPPPLASSSPHPLGRQLHLWN